MVFVPLLSINNYGSEGYSEALNSISGSLCFSSGHATEFDCYRFVVRFLFWFHCCKFIWRVVKGIGGCREQGKEKLGRKRELFHSLAHSSKALWDWMPGVRYLIHISHMGAGTQLLEPSGLLPRVWTGRKLESGDRTLTARPDVYPCSTISNQEVWLLQLHPFSRLFWVFHITCNSMFPFKCQIRTAVAGITSVHADVMANHINVSQGIQATVCPYQSPLCSTAESPSQHHPTAREFWCNSNVPFKTESFIEKPVARVLASLWIWHLQFLYFSKSREDDVRQKALEDDITRTWEQTTFQIQMRSHGED